MKIIYSQEQLAEAVSKAEQFISKNPAKFDRSKAVSGTAKQKQFAVNIHDSLLVSFIALDIFIHGEEVAYENARKRMDTWSNRCNKSAKTFIDQYKDNFYRYKHNELAIEDIVANEIKLYNEHH